MAECVKCNPPRKYKNNASLRQHNRILHGGKHQTIDPDIEDSDSEQSDHGYDDSAIDQLGSESSDSYGTDGAAEDTSRDQDESLTDDSKTDSDQDYGNKPSRLAIKDKRPGKFQTTSIQLPDNFQVTSE